MRPWPGFPHGKLGTANRLFLWSADLVAETAACPGKENPPMPKSSSIDAVLDSLARLTGPGDFVVCFDGRLREERGALEKKLASGGKSLDEIFIVYAADGAAERGNKLFMGARLHEVAYALLPCRRQRLAVAERKLKFLPQGADSTHCPTFANVPLPAVTALSRVSREE